LPRLSGSPGFGLEAVPRRAESCENRGDEMKNLNYRTFDGLIKNKNPEEEWLLEYCKEQNYFHTETVKNRMMFSPKQNVPWKIIFRGTEQEVWLVSDAIDVFIRLANERLRKLKRLSRKEKQALMGKAAIDFI
jgi:hypothetical protein